MKAIIKYQANDGSEWESEDKALEREDLLIMIEDITKACLKPTPRDGNWVGYVQQHPAAVLDYKHTLMRIAKQEGVYGKCAGCECIWDADPKGIRHSGGIANRYIDDGGSEPLRRAWQRLSCMDENYREYNQPYYAINPDKCEGGEVSVDAQQ